MSTKNVKRTQKKIEKTNNRRTVLIGVVIGLTILALGYLLYLGIQEPESLEGLKSFAGLSRGHDEQVDYSELSLPPVGGLHSPVWQNCGIYDQPIEAKNAVHSMEHGAVWIAYQPDLSADAVETLQETVRSESYVVLSPYTNLKSPIVMTAWGIQLELDSADDSRIDDFIGRYQLGPQTPELGATCESGIGKPIN